MRSGSIEVMTENDCHWNSSSGLDGKRLFAHILGTNRGIFKFKRHMFRCDRSDEIEKCCRWKSISGLDEKRLFAHILRTNRRIFEIQTANVQVWSKWWWKNVETINLLPVSTGKGFLLISWKLIDGFSKFKRHMFRFDRSDDEKMLSLKIYFRFRREKTFYLYPEN